MERRGWLSRLRLCAFGIAIAAVAAGCAIGGSGGEAIPGAGTAGDGTIKLVLWGGVPPEAGPDSIVKAWNASHPGIALEYARFVNDDDGNLKLDTALMAGQQVDLYFNYSLSQLERRIDAGIALDLSRFDDYDPDLKMGADAEAWKVDGKYYGVPTKKNAFFVALNKEALDEAGLPVPTSWTWSELREYARALSGTFKYGLLQHMEPFSDPMDSLLVHEGYANASGRSNMDHPHLAYWLTTLREMMTEDRTTPPYGEQVTSKMPVEQMFLNGEAAMLNIGEWLMRSANNTAEYPRDFTIAFAPVPRLSERADEFVTRGGLGDVISINPKSAHIEAAWEFVQWYADGGMLPMSEGGRLPASRDADMDAAMSYFLGDKLELYDVSSLEYVLYGDKTPTFVRSVPQPLLDMRVDEYEKFFLGDQSLERTLANMKRRHEAHIGSGGDAGAIE
ncbi:ABC transporter substrate-binding protein [Paenibacillaceae bacterium WGS1546]|uniref:ABC transporter substrate-binding protein n=1 Tax=Cohnella sp. WGS1546 TaxID=3366810 RepID=UPI00372D6C6D